MFIKSGSCYIEYSAKQMYHDFNLYIVTWSSLVEKVDN